MKWYKVGVRGFPSIPDIKAEAVDYEIYLLPVYNLPVYNLRHIRPLQKTFSSAKLTVKTVKALSAILAFLLFIAPGAGAFGRHKLKVKFHEYSAESLKLAKDQNKPVFILVSAQWCHWCEVFERQALADKRVYTLLNDKFINIFIDADIRSDLLSLYKVSFLPYVVLLTPGGGLYHKYGGALQADDFYGLMQKVQSDIAAGKEGPARRDEDQAYSPPDSLDPESLMALKNSFSEAIHDYYDETRFGFGKRFKTIAAMTLLYLLDDNKDVKSRSFQIARKTMQKAVATIHDRVEGGFFRYAETRNWGIPHYEKMIDTNSAALLLLLKINSISPSADLARAAGKTMDYLSSTLFDEKRGVFLSFQVADTSYYILDKARRAKRKAPVVVNKVFTDRLSLSLVYLLDAYPFIRNKPFKEKIKRSVDFLAEMAEKGEALHYYSMSDPGWSIEGKLADYAFLSLVFQKASSVFKEKRYDRLAKVVTNGAIKKFYKPGTKAFVDGPDGFESNIEYFMELNSALILSMQAINKAKAQPGYGKIIKSVVTSFSGVEEVFLHKAWDASDFRFLDKYAFFLLAAKKSGFSEVN